MYRYKYKVCSSVFFVSCQANLCTLPAYETSSDD
jgi:hypothetical protein